MSSESPELLKVAFCICEGVTLSDFIPPSEIIGCLNFADSPMFPPALGPVPYRFHFDFLAPSLEPLKSVVPGSAGLTVHATQTYEGAQKAGTQYDIIWVPAGPLPNPVTGEDTTPQAEVDFIAAQAPKARYVMSVCGGSAILARAGVLAGKRATTNKSMFKLIETMSPKDITWVAKARWVVDGNVWTSSGVSAGSDMAIEFVKHLVGEKVATWIRGTVEVVECGQDDDPFAVIHGLV